MPFHYDVRQSQVDATKDLEAVHAGNFQTLLKIYTDEMASILQKEGEGQLSNLPLTSKYFYLRNKYQFIADKFKA